jgi:hypothetical protein
LHGWVLISSVCISIAEHTPNVERIVSRLKGWAGGGLFNVNAADLDKRKEVLDKMETQIAGTPRPASCSTRWLSER